MTLLQQPDSASVDLTVAIFAGILLLTLERIVALVADKRKDRKTSEHARKFLKEWFSTVENGLPVTAAHYQEALETWKTYLDQLERNPGIDLRTPKLPYRRIYMPDISDVVISASPYMPQDAYVNLLHLNAKLRLLDERGRRLSDFFDHALLKKPSYDRRLRIAKALIEKLRYVNDLAITAQANSSNRELKNWIVRKNSKATRLRRCSYDL